MSNELVLQGVAALKEGNKLRARQIFISAIKQNPKDEEAWFGLYDAVESTEQRTRCLQEILRINPSNALARQMLEQHQATDESLNALLQKTEPPPSQPTPPQPQPVAPPPPPIQTAACTSCGAPLNIPPDVEHIHCSYCGASLAVQRSAGSVALKLAEKVSQAIQESGTGTQAVIQQGTSVTRDELRQIQLRQDLSTAQLQYSNTRAEIRALEREPRTSKTTRQLKELYATQADLARRIKFIEETIDPSKKVAVSPKAKQTGAGCSSLFSGCLTGVFKLFKGFSSLVKIIIILALILLCIACVVGIAVSGSSSLLKGTPTPTDVSAQIIEKGQPSTIQNPPEPTETPEPAATKTPLPIGLSRNNPYPRSDIVSAPNWDVQVLEVKRGEEAWKDIQAANSFNEAAPEGMEYLLVKLHVKSTYADADEHSISGCDFDLTGDRLTRYSCSMTMVVEPEPQLEARLYTGGEAEGWSAYLVAQGESNLILEVNESLNFDENALRYIALDEGATINISPELSNINPTDSGKDRSNPASRADKIITKDWELSVIEVVRGNDAWKMVQEANQFNDSPVEGMEYIAVKIHVHYIGTEDKVENIDGSSFKTTGSANVLYDPPSVVDPDPTLDIYLYPGGEYEGWIVLQAAKDDTGIVLVFDPLLDFSGKNKRFISLEP